MTPELKPCPHCGGTDIGMADNTGPKLCTAPHAYAWCRNKDCHASGNESDTVAEAIAAWNTRTSPPAPDVSVTYGIHYAGSGGANLLEGGANIILREQSAADPTALVEADWADRVDELAKVLYYEYAGEGAQWEAVDERYQKSIWRSHANAILPIIAREREAAWQDGAKAMQEAAASLPAMIGSDGTAYVDRYAIRVTDPAQLWKDRTP